MLGTKEYFKKVVGANSIYRTTLVQINDGTTGLRIDRWNWDMSNWNGHIHDSKQTRKDLMGGKIIVPITEQEVHELVN